MGRGDIWEEPAPFSLTETSGEKARDLALLKAGIQAVLWVCAHEYVVLVHLRMHMRVVSVPVSLCGSPILLIYEWVRMSGTKFGDKG